MKLFPALLPLLFALAPAALSQDRPGETHDLASAHRARVAERYDAGSWPVGAVRVGLESDLSLEGWTEDPMRAEEGHVTRTFRRADLPDAPISFVLESHVADGAPQAHALLLEWLSGLQSPNRMPSVAELGLAIGDAGYFGRSGAARGAQAWVAFVRGNVAVRLRAFDPRADPGLDLGTIAREIDLALLAAPTVPAAALPPRPAVRELGVERPSVAAGERVRLLVDVEDPHGGTPHLHWIVGGSGLGYVERAKDGHLYLYTTGPGDIELILEVTGSTGTTARGSVRLGVREE